MRRLFLATAVLISSVATAFAEDLPKIKIAAFESGTVNWELDTIKHNKFDEANGFELEVMGVAGGPAANIAFQGGEADIMVSDWLWVASQRAEGKDYVFIPYSKAVGALLVSKDSPAQTLADLKGKKIGIAGGPVDKSWIILQALAKKEHGMDLATETEQVFGAPPLIMKAGLSGEVDAASNFWHFLAKMETAGMRKLVDIGKASKTLGLDPETPLLGYIVKGEFMNEHKELIQGFAKASREAKNLLATDQAAWDRLRERMNVKNDAQFEALIAGWRAGIPAEGAVNVEAAATMFNLMAELGGEKLTGAAKELPEGVFASVE